MKRLTTHEARFDARVVRGESPDDCWGWTGTVLPTGYAQFWPYGRDAGKASAHRYAYERFVGPIPAGYEIDHTCHVASECSLLAACPHRRCSNPRHLEAVTPMVNMRRSHGWTVDAQGAWRCSEGHVIDEGAKGSKCRTCFNAYKARWRGSDGDEGLRKGGAELVAAAARRRELLLFRHPGLVAELDALGIIAVQRRLSSKWTYDDNGWHSPRQGFVPFATQADPTRRA